VRDDLDQCAVRRMSVCDEKSLSALRALGGDEVRLRNTVHVRE
jgi:hypothetical protein